MKKNKPISIKSLKKISETTRVNPRYLQGDEDTMILVRDLTQAELITGQGFKYKEKIKEPDKEYDLQGGWEPHKMDSEDYALLGQAFEILRSKSTYRTALVYNIKAFHRAIKSESIKNIKIERLESDIDELRERIDVLEKEKAFDKGECQP